MALTVFDPNAIDSVAQAYTDALVGTELARPANFQSGLTDTLQPAVFDQQHAIIKSNPISGQSLSTTVDNSIGTEPLTAAPNLSYEYSSGFTNTHEATAGFTVGVSEELDLNFEVVDSKTTLSASTNVSWTDGSSTNETTTLGQAITATVIVPAGKRLDVYVTVDQLNVSVPYSSTTTVTGNINYDPSLWPQGQPPLDVQAPMPRVFQTVHDVFGGGAPISGLDPAGMGSDPAAGTGTYTLNGTLKLAGAGQATIAEGAPYKVYDATDSASQEVQATYDPDLQLGVSRTLDDSGREFADTPFDDRVNGGAGNDRVRLTGGEDVAYGGGGGDDIAAQGVGRSLLDGGDGDDRLFLESDAPRSTIMGGDGNDRISAFAHSTYVSGGAGDDTYFLDGRSAGSVIEDTGGSSRVQIADAGPLGFERVGDNLYILLDGGKTYDRTRDIAWEDFFAGADNRVNGMSANEIGTAKSLPSTPRVGLGEGATWIGDLIQIEYKYPTLNDSVPLGNYIFPEEGIGVGTPIGLELYLGADSIRVENNTDDGLGFGTGDRGVEFEGFSFTDRSAARIASVQPNGASTIELAPGALTYGGDFVQVDLIGARIPPNSALELDLAFV